MKLILKSLGFLTLISFVVCDSDDPENLYEYVDKTVIPELEYMNTNADPCEDFYEYTCGNFKNVHPLPEGKHIWDHFTILQNRIHQLMKVILESKRKPEDPIAVQKAKAAYTACVDVDYADKLILPETLIMHKLGIWPVILPHAYKVEEFSWNKIGDIIAEYGVPLFFNLQVMPNYFNESQNTIYMFRDALSNPSTFKGGLEQSFDDYLKLPETTKTKTSKPIPFETFLRTIAFRLRNAVFSWKSDNAVINDVAETIEFMRYLQGGGIVGNDDEIENLSVSTTVEKLQAWTDKHFGEDYGLDWVEFFNRIFRPSGATVTKNTSIYHSGMNLTYGVLNLVRKSSPRILKNFVMVRLFTYMAPDSDKVMRDAFDTYYKSQNYDVFPRPEYCLRKILGYPGNTDFSMALTYEYQRYHFNVNKLQAAKDMISDLQAAFRDILDEADWIDDETMKAAVRKADSMITLLGYPEYAEDKDLLDEYYESLGVCTWDHFGNSQRARSFRQATNFAEIDNARNREIWNLSPLEVNAFYNRANNRILFPVSVLNPVFFSGNISILDYARIGVIIGHEITHGFDDEGRKFNEYGSLVPWWTNSTEQAFIERTNCFVNQYDNYYIDQIDECVDGRKTLNENLADNGGLREAYKAYKKLQKRTPKLTTIRDYTPEQLFFIGFGTMWCMTETDYYLEQMRLNNVYPPGKYRVIGSVSNMKEFSDAFNCPAGSRMNPVDKCILW